MGYGTTVILQEGIVIYGNLLKKIVKLTGYTDDLDRCVRSYKGYTFISTEKIRDRVDLCKGYIKNGNNAPCECNDWSKYSIGLIKICEHERGAVNQLLMVKGYEYTEDQQKEIIQRAKDAFIKRLHKTFENDEKAYAQIETIVSWFEKRVENDLVMVGDILLTAHW